MAGVAWQLSVRCGTASVDGACGNDIVGRLGLQRTAAGGSAELSYVGAVHHRKTAQATSLVCWIGGGGLVRGWSNEAMSTFDGGSTVSMEALGSGVALPSILMVIFETDP